MSTSAPTQDDAPPLAVVVCDTPWLRSSTGLRRRLHQQHGVTLGPDAHALGPALALYVTAHYPHGDSDAVIFDIVDTYTGATYDIDVPVFHLRGAEDTPRALAQLVVDHGLSALTVLRALCDADGLLTVPLRDALTVVAAAHQMPNSAGPSPSHP